MNYLFALFIGIIECFFLSLNTKFLQRSKKIPCFIVSFINVLLWFIVIGLAVENLKNWGMKLSYALGFASGDIFAIAMDNYLEQIAKFRGVKIKHKKHIKRKK